VVAGVPARRRASSLLAEAGVGLGLRRVTHLVGIHSDGSKEHFGECVFGKQRLLWDLWLPHLGVALDEHERSEEEIEAKYAWAQDRGIIYFAPDEEFDLETFRRLTKDRRKLRQFRREDESS
jgi:hypothetical protein